MLQHGLPHSLRSGLWILCVIVFLCLQSTMPASARPEKGEPQKNPTLNSATISGCQIFPENNVWNTPIDTLPVHTRSSQWINTIGRYTGFHMDFGSGTWNGGPIGIPFNIVDSMVQTVPVSFYYDDQSDPGPYPIPANPLIEYGSDQHLLILDNSTCILYEIYDASYVNNVWYGGSGAIWDLNSNGLRPDTWTSADAAGLPILPGLVRYDEIVSSEIKHAIRFTAANTNGYIWPARHLTSNDPSAPQIPPMGARFRLKASFNITGYPAAMQVILKAMKTYGIILADNGSNWYVSGTPDERWDNDLLHLLDDLTGNDFEAVDTSSLIINYDSGATGFILSGNVGAAGVTLNYAGSSITGESGGNYSIVVPYLWSGIVTPSKACYTFEPPNRSYANVLADQTSQDYTATFHPTLTLTGNTGVAGVTLSYFDGTAKTVNSDNNGNYTVTVSCGWSGTVTPSRTGFSFVPSNISYTNVVANQTGQGYVASWVGGFKVEADRNVVAVGRPHIGSEVASYGGFSSGSLTAYVPMLFKGAFGSYDSALYVQNVHDTNTANITIKYYDSTGILKCTKADTIAPLASRGYWLPSVTCDTGSLPAGWVGGAVVTSDQPIVAVGRPHVGGEVMTYDGFASGSLSTYVPMLFKGAFGGSYNAAFYVQNAHASNTASITIKYYDSSGLLKCTKADTVAPLASKGYWVPTATCDTGSLPAGWVGGVVVTSTQPIVAVGRPHIGSQVTTYNGFPAGSASAYVPMLFKDAFGSYDSAFYLQNTHDTNTANVTIKYYDSAGALNCTRTDTIAPLASKGYWLPTATCDTGSLPAGWVGGVVVTSDQPLVAVGRPHLGAQVTTYDGFAVGSLNTYVPMLFRDSFGGSYDSALYLQNLDPANMANLTIKLYDASGNLACTVTDTLSALASKGYWLPGFLCPP